MNRNLVETFTASVPRFETDKHNPDHTWFSRSYLDIYDRVFGDMRDRIESILEIGVLQCGSLRLWKAWAPHARVVGLDIDPAAQAFCPPDCTLITGSQDDPGAVAQAIAACGGSPTVVIDDGSHAVEHMLASFRLIWPSLPSGAFYAIEDLRCTYDHVDPKWPGIFLNAKPLLNDRSILDEFLRENVKQMDFHSGSIASIGIYPMQLFFEKG